MKNAPLTHIFISICFIFNTLGPICPLAYSGNADEFRLPAPGVMVNLSPPLDPPILKGIKVHPDNPFIFDFILDKGESVETPFMASQKDAINRISTRLIKYFLAGLTIPEKDLWVNLSPYEKDHIITQAFGMTLMGRDLLAEDYMLKQITATLIYPEDQVGKKFWKRIYEEAARKYGTTNIPVNTFNKVWIVPDKAVIYENPKTSSAYVVESKLKVMLEQDYLSLSKHAVSHNETSSIGANIIREIVIPELTREVNEDKNFAQLRQVYNSLILATWYKNKIKDSILEQVYADKNKVAGVRGPNDIPAIYQRYLQAFKRGVYNYIKEDVDPITQETVPRKYFSGGFDGAMISVKLVYAQASQVPASLGPNRAQIVTVNCAMVNLLKKIFRPQADIELDKVHALITEKFFNPLIRVANMEGYPMEFSWKRNLSSIAVGYINPARIELLGWFEKAYKDKKISDIQMAYVIANSIQHIIIWYTVATKENELKSILGAIDILQASGFSKDLIRAEVIPFIRKMQKLKDEAKNDGAIKISEADDQKSRELHQYDQLANAADDYLDSKQENKAMITEERVHQIINEVQDEKGSHFPVEKIREWISPYLINGMSDENQLKDLLKHMLNQVPDEDFRVVHAIGAFNKETKEEKDFFKKLKLVVAELMAEKQNEIVITTIGPGNRPGQIGEIYEAFLNIIPYFWEHGLKHKLIIKLRLYDKNPQSLFALESKLGLQIGIRELKTMYSHNEELAQNIQIKAEYYYGDILDASERDRMLLPSNITFWRNTWALKNGMPMAEAIAFVDEIKRITRGAVFVRELYDTSSKIHGAPLIVQDIVNLPIQNAAMAHFSKASDALRESYPTIFVSSQGKSYVFSYIPPKDNFESNEFDYGVILDQKQIARISLIYWHPSEQPFKESLSFQTSHLSVMKIKLENPDQKFQQEVIDQFLDELKKGLFDGQRATVTRVPLGYKVRKKPNQDNLKFLFKDSAMNSSLLGQITQQEFIEIVKKLDQLAIKGKNGWVYKLNLISGDESASIQLFSIKAIINNEGKRVKQNVGTIQISKNTRNPVAFEMREKDKNQGIEIKLNTKLKSLVLQARPIPIPNLDNLHPNEQEIEDLFSASLKKNKVNLAQITTQVKKSNAGGIDLTPANMHLQVKNNYGAIKFHINPAMLKEFQNAPGLTPVIIHIQPLTDLRRFLGLTDKTAVSDPAIL